MSQPETTRPAAEDCYALLSELRLTYHDGTVGISADGFFVIIYQKVKRPAMIKFRGWPIEYRIGGGMARAYGAEVT